jgi:hypothetical protein
MFLYDRYLAWRSAKENEDAVNAAVGQRISDVKELISKNGGAIDTPNFLNSIGIDARYEYEIDIAESDSDDLFPEGEEPPDRPDREDRPDTAAHYYDEDELERIQ